MIRKLGTEMGTVGRRRMIPRGVEYSLIEFPTGPRHWRYRRYHMSRFALIVLRRCLFTMLSLMTDRAVCEPTMNPMILSRISAGRSW